MFEWKENIHWHYCFQNLTSTRESVAYNGALNVVKNLKIVKDIVFNIRRGTYL